MNYQSIQVSYDDGICTVTLNRPEVRNALGLEMREEIKHLFSSIKYDDAVKVIILTGAGKAFSAGGDLSALKEVNAASGRQRLQAGHEMIQAILTIEKPVIAAVNGAAAGAGFSLALACDFIIAAQSAAFIQSFVKVGLIPDLGSAYFLPGLIGRNRALELMLLGEKVTPDQAKHMGIINQVAADERLMEEVLSLAAKLKDGPGMAMGFAKKLVNQSALAEIDKIFELEGFAQGMCFESDSFKEGLNAFFEKRKPIFNQK